MFAQAVLPLLAEPPVWTISTCCPLNRLPPVCCPLQQAPACWSLNKWLRPWVQNFGPNWNCYLLYVASCCYSSWVQHPWFGDTVTVTHPTSSAYKLKCASHVWVSHDVNHILSIPRGLWSRDTASSTRLSVSFVSAVVTVNCLERQRICWWGRTYVYKLCNLLELIP